MTIDRALAARKSGNERAPRGTLAVNPPCQLSATPHQFMIAPRKTSGSASLRPARGVPRPPGHVPAGHQTPCRNHIAVNVCGNRAAGAIPATQPLCRRFLRRNDILATACLQAPASLRSATRTALSPLARRHSHARPIWEQNGNRIGNISPMRLQCTCVRAVS